ncbi:acetyl-coenzyme A transporter 1 [Anopheles arabiensis]|uniref:Acetyl-coa transporter n=2 Tax=gambiae species complex TaxID=44542 RepID=A0A182I6R4_ANOAR|nr:acetyl-coenzyme A transporter 1 [Anopheles arabiensis]XP_040168688.1 acetyl-coenzyme A transporter 1 [Anopheles arabiensis]XP_041774050.1 acetyl-coenzyme A transporter 1 [Anopheles merus]
MSNRRKKTDRHDHETLLPPVDADEEKHEKSDLRGDWGNIAILFFLYLLQGIPIGLASAIPMLLQNRGASYKQQAEFSFAHWPFSLKLLWAPIVDSLFWKRFGRRKSWLIPTQYLIGIFMLILSLHVNRWLGAETTDTGGDDHATEQTSTLNIPLLTVIFFMLNFLAATQDIAVDGWALTMLKRCNVGHASTCNSVGQTAGYFLGYVAFMALESAEFCNSYLRAEPAPEGLVNLSGYLWFWGLVFLVTTTLVALGKRELSPSLDRGHEEHLELDIKQTYRLLVDIMKMKPILTLVAILLTAKAGFAACDAVTSLKLIDAGVPKDKLALLVVPLVPLQIVLPLAISKYTAGTRPMEVYLKAIPYRIGLTLAAAAIVWITPAIIRDHHVPYYYYMLLLTNYGLYQIALYSMFVAVMAFFARISDPAVGGTYMTLLNTLSNLGGNWPTTVVLWLVDYLTWKRCSNSADNDCSDGALKDACSAGGGKCTITIDGYYIEIFVCLLYGLVWYRWGSGRIRQLQELPLKAWRVARRVPRTHSS